MQEDTRTHLYLVPTPIGNLEDITLRAIRILKEVDGILAEDTRTTGHLLRHLDISQSVRSFHIHNEHRTVAAIVERLKAGEVLALVSDAGTPGISDPGFLLVRACLEAGLQVECLPGPTALIPALVKSGLPTDRFAFEGFLPHKKGRSTRLKALAEESRTLVFYESPHRVLRTLQELADVLGAERLAAVSRELTKVYEETRRGTLQELHTWFTQHPPKGEFVLVVQGKF
ncbi:16S rRNA (cytidine1402-2'-O)-methyltransferase [Catalinimonas alkaloidigena]|uniref:Ribosomal RNA small subunit methyltransferase I n=1 Tax=Catalinimonas alkaloidigena TaxID=1075417 RepID=A0A1G9ERP6_9BACT|nr:16S rRNA (cytidine(1402)-2'-O)-methyltransferase [Catalinimonas alkaloidigena]SDK78816.1 16S rRNA (cytidine1402-2'-O)-methyltransferase [Catalinimonas alkaloidigena]